MNRIKIYSFNGAGMIKYLILGSMILGILFTSIELIQLKTEFAKYSELIALSKNLVLKIKPTARQNATSLTTNPELQHLNPSSSTTIPSTTPSSTIPKENLVKERVALSHIIFDSVEKDNVTVYTTVVVISSYVNHRNRRDRIRQSWGNSSNWNALEKYKIVFVVGRVSDAKPMMEIAEEAKTEKDIIYIDVFEDFYLLAKKVIIGLIWAKHNIKFKAVLKGDDDTFMNIDNINEFVKSNIEEDAYFGNKIHKARVRRTGRYMVPKEEHESNYYSPYCSGAGFFLSNSSIRKMIPFFDLDRVWRIDDAYIGEVAFLAGNITFFVIKIFLLIEISTNKCFQGISFINNTVFKLY